jgi:hypothetical protein
MKIAVTQLRRLVTGFPPRRPEFDTRARHVGFVMDNVALEQVSSENVGFPCQFSFHQMLHTHPSSGVGAVGQIVGSASPHTKDVWNECVYGRFDTAYLPILHSKKILVVGFMFSKLSTAAAAFHLHIRKVLDSSLCPDTVILSGDFRGFPLYLRHSGMETNIRQQSPSTNSSKFVIHYNYPIIRIYTR